MRTRYKWLMALPLVLGLSQCSGPKAPSPYSFTLSVELTPEAAAQVKAKGEGIGITAFYYGQATEAAQAEADEVHRIRLGYEANIYGGDARKIHLTADLDTSLFPKIVNQEPLVLLTAYSASKMSNPDDLLECHSVVVPIKAAQATPPVIKCGLAGAA